MAEPTLPMDADDDLPRTTRRERDAKEAREREAREWDARERLPVAPTPIRAFERQVPYGFAAPAGPAATFDVPFGN